MKTYKERLIENIDAIGIAHTQMMTILKEEIDLENINEDKWKAVAEGKGKAQDVADKLLSQLKSKEDELLKINNPEKHKEQVAEKVLEEHGDSNLNNRLR
jgi:hypothetical protein